MSAADRSVTQLVERFGPQLSALELAADARCARLASRVHAARQRHPAQGVPAQQAVTAIDEFLRRSSLPDTRPSRMLLIQQIESRFLRAHAEVRQWRALLHATYALCTDESQQAREFVTATLPIVARYRALHPQESSSAAQRAVFLEALVATGFDDARAVETFLDWWARPAHAELPLRLRLHARAVERKLPARLSALVPNGGVEGTDWRRLKGALDRVLARQGDCVEPVVRACLDALRKREDNEAPPITERVIDWYDRARAARANAHASQSQSLNTDPDWLAAAARQAAQQALGNAHASITELGKSERRGFNLNKFVSLDDSGRINSRFKFLAERASTIRRVRTRFHSTDLVEKAREYGLSNAMTEVHQAQPQACMVYVAFDSGAELEMPMPIAETRFPGFNRPSPARFRASPTSPWTEHPLTHLWQTRLAEKLDAAKRTHSK